MIRSTIAASVLALFLSPTSQAGVIIDPTGDTFLSTFGQFGDTHDLTGVTWTLSATELSLTVSFVDPISAPSDFAANSVGGYIDFDIDQNGATGFPSNVDAFSPAGAATGLGMEFFVDIFSELFNPGMVEVVDAATFFPVGSVPITFDTHSFSLTIPLAFLGGDDGILDLGVVVGDFNDSSDNVAGSTSSGLVTVPEPSSVATWFGLCAASCVWTWRRRRKG